MKLVGSAAFYEAVIYLVTLFLLTLLFIAVIYNRLSHLVELIMTGNFALPPSIGVCLHLIYLVSLAHTSTVHSLSSVHVFLSVF